MRDSHRYEMGIFGYHFLQPLSIARWNFVAEGMNGSRLDCAMRRGAGVIRDIKESKEGMDRKESMNGANKGFHTDSNKEGSQNGRTGPIAAMARIRLSVAAAYMATVAPIEYPVT